MRDLSKIIVAKGFKKLPKLPKIAKSGHTDHTRRQPHQPSLYFGLVCISTVALEETIFLKIYTFFNVAKLS